MRGPEGPCNLINCKLIQFTPTAALVPVSFHGPARTPGAVGAPPAVCLGRFGRIGGGGREPVRPIRFATPRDFAWDGGRFRAGRERRRPGAAAANASTVNGPKRLWKRLRSACAVLAALVPEDGSRAPPFDYEKPWMASVVRAADPVRDFARFHKRWEPRAPFDYEKPRHRAAVARPFGRPPAAPVGRAESIRFAIPREFSWGGAGAGGAGVGASRPGLSGSGRGLMKISI